MKQKNMGRLSSALKKEEAFISVGFSSCKDALADFRSHQALECHSKSITYEHIVSKCGNVCEMTSNAIAATMLENRKCFLKIVYSIQYFGRQAIAMQGITEAA